MQFALQIRQAMLAARSLACTDPQAGGTSGIFLVGLFERLGIAGAMRNKALRCINGDKVVDKVLAGAAELGSPFLSEIMPVKGGRAAGPLPAAPIENVTAYAARVMAGSPNGAAAARFIAMLTAPAQRAAWVSFWFEPLR
jgi:molybdate transport system substrate-binding protein